ncbi:MAG: Hydroxypyruvate isomerase [Firmicutes bacterium ADurb.Bin300]|nr:MAG: Hydroxypyruvate isomerase [Firmicutes bacterium ADurb.Bin300]
MIKFSVCIEMIFNDQPIYERFFRVKDAGLEAAEIWDWGNRDISELKEATEKSGIILSSMCVGTADALLARKYRETPLVANCASEIFCEIASCSVETAKQLNVKNLIVTTGQERADISREKQHENIVKALSAAAPIFESGGITAVLEPLNVLVDHKGYYLSSSAQAADIIKEVKSENIKMLFDIYHQQITEGNIINNINQYKDLIGHFHIADNPGRHEPGTGELNYSAIFKAIEKTGYEGFVGLEFAPLASCSDALKSVIDLK